MKENFLSSAERELILEKSEDGNKQPNKKSTTKGKKSWEELDKGLKHEMREKIYPWVTKLTKYYLWFVAGVISVSILFRCISFWLIIGALKLEAVDTQILNIFPLSDSVLIALLTTTTITIIGLPLIILNSLFPKEKK
jgi:hypothetical protein